MANENTKIVLVGDSRLDMVYGEDGDQRNLIGHLIAEVCPVRVMTYAAGGQRLSPFDTFNMVDLSFSQNMYSMVYPHGLYSSIKTIVIMLAYNDWKNGGATSLDDYREALIKVIKTFKKMGLTVVIISDPWTMDSEEETNGGGYYLQDFRDCQEEVADEYGAVKIIGKSLVQNIASNFDGGVHWTNAGHIEFTTNFVSQMQAISQLPASYV